MPFAPVDQLSDDSAAEAKQNDDPPPNLPEPEKRKRGRPPAMKKPAAAKAKSAQNPKTPSASASSLKSPTKTSPKEPKVTKAKSGMKRPAGKKNNENTDEASEDRNTAGTEEPKALKKPAKNTKDDGTLKVYAYPYKSGVWGVKIVGQGEKIRVACLQTRHNNPMASATYKSCFTNM